MIRVAMFIHGYYPLVGGAERQLHTIAPFLQREGIEVHVVTRHHPNLAKFEVIDGVPVHRLPNHKIKPVASVLYTSYAIPLMRRLQPHILHAHGFTSPTTTALLAKKALGIPAVITAHRTGYLGDVQRLQRRKMGDKRLEGIRDNTNMFIMISREVEEELAGIGVPENKRTYLPNGVDAECFAPPAVEQKQAIRTALNLPQDAQIVIFTGRLAPEKRVKNLIAVWDDIRQRHPNALLLILGTGELENELKADAGKGVRFEGKIDNVIPYLQASDVFVLPSIAEGLSVAMLEAMSCGLPAVITQVGGAADVITSGENGFLIPPDDVPALRQTLMEVLDSGELRANVGQKARETVLKDFQLPVIAAKLRSVYEQVIG